MTDKLFFSLWQDALAQPDRDMYIAEYGYPDWFDSISPDADEVVEILTNIHRAAHMSVRDLVRESGLTQSAFAVRFCIPLRTVQDWCSSGSNHREPPAYLRLMIAQLLGLLTVPRG